MKNNTKKLRNISFVIAFLIISCLLICFNYYMDAYGYAPEKIKKMEKIDINTVSRDMIYTYLNKTKDVKIETVIIGTSSATPLFNVDLFHCYTASRIAMLSLPNLSIQETNDLLTYFLKLHPEAQHVMVSFDVNTYLYCLPYATLPKKPTSFVQDFIKLYYSVDVSKISLKNFLSRFEKKDKPVQEDEGYYVNTKRKYKYDENTNFCMQKNLSQLKEIKQLIESKNLKTTYFMTPLHALYFSNMYKTEQLEKVENLKRELAKITPFYDMAYITRHTAEPFEYFWADVIHPLPFINDKIYDVLVYNKPNSEIAVLVNSENIEENLKYQRKLIEEFIKENPDYVNEYVNSELSNVEMEAC